eukprot:362645-Chlamydomonas_euryale.AAC.5
MCGCGRGRDDGGGVGVHGCQVCVGAGAAMNDGGGVDVQGCQACHDFRVLFLSSWEGTDIGKQSCRWQQRQRRLQNQPLQRLHPCRLQNQPLQRLHPCQLQNQPLRACTHAGARSRTGKSHVRARGLAVFAGLEGAEWQAAPLRVVTAQVRVAAVQVQAVAVQDRVVAADGVALIQLL